jgi:hypothetical protein
MAEGGQEPRNGGLEFSAGTIHYEIAERNHAMTCGGIGAMHQLANNVGLVEAINIRPRILQRRRPYKDTTSSTGRMAARPVWPIPPYCVACTIAMSTNTDIRSSSGRISDQASAIVTGNPWSRYRRLRGWRISAGRGSAR